MSSHTPHNEDLDLEDEDLVLAEDEAAEEIPEDEDAPMDSDGEEEGEEEEEDGQEIQLQNDSIAHFDHHTSSIFCIASHPLTPSLIATGSGDDSAYVFSIANISPPLLPASYESNPSPSSAGAGRESIPPIQKLEGHTDSVNAITWTLPRGEFLATAGLDGNLRIYTTPSLATTSGAYKLLAEAKDEVPEINFLVACPHPSYPNTLALGASDGSVWIYTVDPSDKASPLQVQHAYYLHTGSVTAGAWTPDGKLLATVSEDGSLYIYDPFGEAAAAGIKSEGQSIISLTAADQRFEVEGGLYSIAISPSGGFLATGGGGGMIKVVGLPALGAGASTQQNKKGTKGKASSTGGGGGGGGSQTGQILATLHAQTDGIETLAFSTPPLTLLAAGSVDSSIALFDTAHRFAVRRHIRNAHDEYAVVKVDFVSSPSGPSAGAENWLLTSAGMDGVLRRWDTRGGTAAAGMGLVKEWKGHRGEGEGGGVLGFVQYGGRSGGRIVSAGDDGVSLVFAA